MMLHQFSQDQLRNACRATIETLEYWLRRVVDAILRENFGDGYLDYKIKDKEPIIKPQVLKDIRARVAKESKRYTREIDAAMLHHLVDIICHPALYQSCFRVVFHEAFPEGEAEARTFFNRLLTPRNHLSHANSISIRQAERVICYAHDIIDSIKQYYIRQKINMEFNVPRFIKYNDHFGNEIYFDQNKDGYQFVQFNKEPIYYLRPGEILSIEVTVDETFPVALLIIKGAVGPIACLPQHIKGCFHLKFYISRSIMQDHGRKQNTFFSYEIRMNSESITMHNDAIFQIKKA